MGSVELVWRKIGFTPLNALRTLFVLLYFFSVCFGTLICWLEGTCPDGEVEGCHVYKTYSKFGSKFCKQGFP